MDNRGLIVRGINYNRTSIEDASLDELITQSTYSCNGRIKTVVDPRFFSLQMSEDKYINNVYSLESLGGKPLFNKSIDAGQSYGLSDVQGNIIWSINSNGVQTEIEHDRLGRPTSFFETSDGQTRCIQRNIYGETETNPNENNLRGQLVRVYDEAGCISTSSISINGQIIAQTRMLRRDFDISANWQGIDESEWKNELDSEEYVTKWSYDANGNIVSLTDANGNISETTYNPVGQVVSSSITLIGEEKQDILVDMQYNASGQKLMESLSNNISTEYEYERETSRLIRAKTTRSEADFKTVLRDINYEYDPVGNILTQYNAAEEARTFRNQVVEPKNEYTYDALYQLISATGRESDALRTNRGYISAARLDESQYDNYTRNFAYDRGGNLFQIRHHGAYSFTQAISVSKESNRAIFSDSEEIEDIDSRFDNAGNQLELFDGIPLKWNTHNQLSSVLTVSRDSGEDDIEQYVYGLDHKRLLKRTSRLVSGNMQITTVLYLPGIELYVKKYGDRVQEDLHVITSGPGLRILHWENDTQPDGITGDQYRFGILDHINSLSMEIDQDAQIISYEEYYPYGGTAIWSTRSQIESEYKTRRYSGKVKDATGLYYFGFRYYMPWIGRWLNPDPAGTMDGLNLYCMVNNNPISNYDSTGLGREDAIANWQNLRNKVRNTREQLKRQAYMKFRETQIELIREKNSALESGHMTKQEYHSTLVYEALTLFKGGANYWGKTIRDEHGNISSVRGGRTSHGEPNFYTGYKYGAYERTLAYAYDRSSTHNEINHANVLDSTAGAGWLNKMLPGSLPKLKREEAIELGGTELARQHKLPLVRSIAGLREQLGTEEGFTNRKILETKISILQDQIVFIEGTIEAVTSPIDLMDKFITTMPGKVGNSFLWKIFSAEFALNAAYAGRSSFTYPKNARLAKSFPNTIYARIEEPIMRAGGTLELQNVMEDTPWDPQEIVN